jgi:hypothetical protein
VKGAVLCCAVLCCAVLCCAVLCCGYNNCNIIIGSLSTPCIKLFKYYRNCGVFIFSKFVTSVTFLKKPTAANKVYNSVSRAVSKNVCDFGT